MRKYPDSPQPVPCQMHVRPCLALHAHHSTTLFSITYPRILQLKERRIVGVVVPHQQHSVIDAIHVVARAVAVVGDHSAAVTLKGLTVGVQGHRYRLLRGGTF